MGNDRYSELTGLARNHTDFDLPMSGCFTWIVRITGAAPVRTRQRRLMRRAWRRSWRARSSRKDLRRLRPSSPSLSWVGRCDCPSGDVFRQIEAVLKKYDVLFLWMR